MEQDIENTYKTPDSPVEKQDYFLDKPRDISLKDLLFSFQGRVNRKQFWMVLGPTTVFHCIALTNLILFAIVFVATLFPSLAA